MKKIASTAGIGFLLLVLLNAFGLETPAQINGIMNRMDAYNQSLQTLQADVVLEKYDSVLKESDRSTGTIKYLPKTAKRVMYARIDWATPVVEHISLIGDAYTLYRPHMKQVIKGRAGQTKNKVPAGALSFLTMSKTQLKNNYTVKYLGDEKIPGGGDAMKLELTPKDQAAYKVAYLWVTPNGLPVLTQVVEKNNDWTKILLSNVKENMTLNAEIFDIKYPSSIKAIAG